MSENLPQPNEETQQAIAVRPSSNLLLMPVMNLDVARQRLREFQSFVKEYLVEGEDYGIIPGTNKPTLLKPGSDKLCELYGLADTYQITSRIEDWDKNLFDYEVSCTLLSKRDGSIVGTGLGSCNSYEGRYRWREGQRKCPNCDKATIIKGKAEYGGGWICFAKKGGCGAKFKDGDKAIEGQQTGRIENDDIPTLKNTILKMAKKRAKIDATLGATRSSGSFTQDLEDMPGHHTESHQAPPPQQQAGQPEETTTTQPSSFPEGSEQQHLAKELEQLVKDPAFNDGYRKLVHALLASTPTVELLKKKLQLAREHKATQDAKQPKTRANGVARSEPVQETLVGEVVQ